MKIQKPTGCIVLDIDDTLIKTDSREMSVYKQYPDGHEERLSTQEFANDPDVGS